ncbi:MAG: DinB family protein [Deltaproteobacteria bacterium]|nr:DinB family protein [Deltaproteobacteria bacterium]
MSSKISELVLPAARQVKGYADRLLRGIPAEIFSSMARVGGEIVEANHPAFVTGHLSLYPSRIMRLFGREYQEVTPPDSYLKLFTFECRCIDDPEGAVYPKRDELLEFFESSMTFLLDNLTTLTDEELMAQSRDERSKERFPIVGSFVVYLLTAHPNSHLGQISTWRRCMGLGAA